MLKILTLNWNGKDKLEKLYPSLMPNLKDINYQFLIKDNGSRDNSAEYIKSLNNENIKLIEYPNNLQNFSQGCNLLFNESNANDEDDILLLNNDVIFNDTTSLKKMLNIIHSDKDVGIVGARILYTGTNKLQHAGVVFKKGYNLPYHFRVGEISDSNAEKNRYFQAVTGAVLLTKAKYYRGSFVNKDGNVGLCQEMVWCFDDIFYSIDVGVNQNKKIVYCGKTNISHEESATLKKNPVNKLFMNHNSNYFRNKWDGKYTIDEDLYKNPKYNLYKESK